MALYNFLSKEEHKYETVVIDSITEINEIIKAGIEKKRGRALQLQDWSEVAKDIEGILRAFRGLDMHVIFIAQEKIDKDEDKVIKIFPSLNGAAATKIAYFMDIVGHISVTPTGEHVVNTQPSPKYVTKDRTGLIGNGIAADFNMWIEAVSALETKNTEELQYDSAAQKETPAETVTPEPKEEAKTTPGTDTNAGTKKEEPKEQEPLPETPAEKKEAPKKETPKAGDKVEPMAKAKKVSEKQIALLQDLYLTYSDKKGDAAKKLPEILAAYKVGGIPCKTLEDLTTTLASDLITKLKKATM